MYIKYKHACAVTYSFKLATLTQIRQLSKVPTIRYYVPYWENCCSTGGNTTSIPWSPLPYPNKSLHPQKLGPQSLLGMYLAYVRIHTTGTLGSLSTTIASPHKQPLLHQCPHCTCNWLVYPESLCSGSGSVCRQMS